MSKLPILLILSILFLFGCTTSKPTQEITEPVVVLPEPEPEPVESEPVPPEPEPEPVEPEPEPEPELSLEEQEFLRSTEALGDGAVSIDTFTQDKKSVLETIDKLAVIMKNNDYNGWLKYVSPNSKIYWTNPRNLKEVGKKLPVKGLKISSLRDYFRYIFVPARAGHQVDEIRYISDTWVKAVQVQEDRDIVFYTFEKIDGKWLLKLDTL